MQLHHVVNTFGAYLQRRFGEKIYKLSLDGGFSCPNRNGVIGRGGCTFCNVSSFIDPNNQNQSIAVQLAKQALYMQKAKRYLAYFQAYTSTYAEVSTLNCLYQAALRSHNIVGICVGTRPDCLTVEALQLLADYHTSGYEVWLELGLQSAHNATLKRINRGHDWACFQRAAAKAARFGLNVCVHLIIGLPAENQAHNIATLKAVLRCPIQGLKLHPLHIVSGSTMAKAWQAGRIEPLALTDYVTIASNLIRQTPKHILYHRISATARKPTLLAPDWCQNHWQAMNAIDANLRRFGSQGSDLGDPYRPFPTH